MDLIMETLMVGGGQAASTVMFALQLKQLLSDLHETYGHDILAN